MEKNIGYLAFVGAVIISVIGAFIVLDANIVFLALILGVVTGLLNIDKAESLPFMVASLVLGLGPTVLKLPSYVPYLSQIFINIGVVALAASSTVALVWLIKHAQK